MSFTAIPVLAVLVASTAVPLAGQNVEDEFWPKLYIFVNQGTTLRMVSEDFFNLGTQTKQGNFAYYLDFALKPFFRRDLRDREDVFRRRFLTFRAGYRYRTSFLNNSSTSENRIIAESTVRYPAYANFVVSDRNCGEFRFIKGEPFSMRYRNKLNVEHDVRLGRIVFTPYAYDEVFYDTRYAAWSRNSYAFGLQVPAGPHLVVEPYYLRQTNYRSTPKLVNAAGLTLNLYF